MLANAAPSTGYGTLFVLVLLIVASVWLGAVAQRVVQKGAFLKGYFLGNRGLGAWALALTATVQSGGTFMGFPSLVYSHGWIVALWIAGYMVVPLTGFGVVGKRLAQLSRRTGAVTVPDLFRERFNSPAVGLVALVFVLTFMTSMMIAQFKAGALIMKIAWPNSGVIALSEDLNQFELKPAAVESLRKQNVPTSVVDSLVPLVGKPFNNDAEFKAEVAKVLSKDDFKTHGKAIAAAAEPFDWLYLMGLVIFGLTVVGYTLIGGFLAAVWTDLFQSVMMLFGVILLAVLAIPAAGGLEQATLTAIHQKVSVDSEDLIGAAYAFGPGYSADGREFMPITLGISFFMVWVFAGIGSPASIVRVMASKSTAHIRKSIFLLGGYNLMIYIPLIMICICGRSLIPSLPAGKSDEIIPRLTLLLTGGLPAGSLLAGLVLTAPFGAVMATVSGYLVVIASGIVRDIFQRFIRPQATNNEIRRLTYITMITVGIFAFAMNVKPVPYLQVFVVFSGTGGAVTFVVPALMACYWRRANSAGCIAAMMAGGGTLIAFYIAGSFMPDPKIGVISSVRPFYFLGFDPIVWGMSASAIAGVAVSFLTAPPDKALVAKMFDAAPSAA